MRLTRDNYELLMFDLLEGNLSEQEELQLMNQIEANEFFFHEWNLFKSTILKPDHTIVFAKKELLYKEEKKILPMRLFYRVAVAAVVILAIGFGLYEFSEREKLAADLEPINKETTDQNIPGLDKSTPTGQGSVENHLAEESEFSPKDLIKKDLDGINQEKESGPFVVIPAPAPESEQAEPLLPLPVNNMESITPDLALTNSVIVPEDELVLPIQQIPNSNVTLNTAERIRGVLANTMSKANHPHLKIKPDWKEKGLTIALETDGYLAVASINPFKRQ
jgi:hypothetical protein